MSGPTMDLGNSNSTSGNNNVGAFNGNLNGGTNNGNGNVGVVQRQPERDRQSSTGTVAITAMATVAR